MMSLLSGSVSSAVGMESGGAKVSNKVWKAGSGCQSWGMIRLKSL